MRWMLVLAPFAVACGAADSSPNDGGASDGPAAADLGGPRDAWMTTDGGPFHGGRPGACTAGVPAGGKAVDTSTPSSVVGTGDAASCTFDKLAAAVAGGGIITFKCGAAPVTI